jgi:hypothetical protein
VGRGDRSNSEIWHYGEVSGYPQQSPYVTIANRQAETMMRIAAEFGFTPAIGKLRRLPRSVHYSILWTVIMTLELLASLRATGVTTIGATTRALNQRGIRSPRGGQWHVSSVSNLFARANRIGTS